MGIHNPPPYFFTRLPGWLLIALFAFPALPLNITNILFISFSAYVLLYWIFIRPLEIWRRIRISLVMTVPFIPYFIEYIFHLGSNTMFFEFQKKLLFFIAPLSIAVYAQVFRPKSIRPFLNMFTLSVSALGIVSVAGLIIDDVLFSVQNYENEAYLLRSNFEAISHLHPTYYGLFAAIAALWILYDMDSYHSKWKTVLYVLAFFLTATIVLIAAKMPLFILLLGFCRIIYLRAKNRRTLIRNYILTALIVPAVFFLTPSLRSRVTGINATELSTLGQRQLIFDCSRNVFLENIWTGTGATNAQQQLDNCYKSRDAALESYRYNSHNQFLTIGINYGIFVLLLFIIALVVMIRQVKASAFAIIIVASTLLIMLTESILERQMGVYFFLLFWMLLLNQKYFSRRKLF